MGQFLLRCFLLIQFCLWCWFGHLLQCRLSVLPQQILQLFHCCLCSWMQIRSHRYLRFPLEHLNELQQHLLQSIGDCVAVSSIASGSECGIFSHPQHSIICQSGGDQSCWIHLFPCWNHFSDCHSGSQFFFGSDHSMGDSSRNCAIVASNS